MEARRKLLCSTLQDAALGCRGIDLRPGWGSHRPIGVGSLPFYSISFYTVKSIGISNGSNIMNSTALEHVSLSSIRNITGTNTYSITRATGRGGKIYRSSLES
ncbi:hypothetical protein E2C01_020016 [Portunus trituberculatus]|uniref:Uncharacterized protein n=1 Tax=Portunus trituberculatus TaxID=210409 RepID=A0A5B7E072_PORTR|nr:hypothetical protein [Portunus trituberculatus]